MKVAVIGYSGSGKSTLTKRVGECLHLPVLYMDQVHWLPNWIERQREEEQKIIQDFLNEHEEWIIDGNYFSLAFDERMKQADQIIWMDFHRFNCLWRVMKRYRKHKGKARESMSSGCDEKIDWEFIRWILKDGRTKQIRMRYEKLKQMYPEKMIVLHHQKELDQFLRSYANL